MSKLLDQLIAETGIELHSSRYDVAAAMIERELQAKWDAGYEAAKAQHQGFTPGPPDGGNLGVGVGTLPEGFSSVQELREHFRAHLDRKAKEATGVEPAAYDLRVGKLPSPADLDAVADEQKAKEATE